MRARGILCDNERTLMKNGMRAGINFRRTRINLQPAVNFSDGIRILMVISHCNSSHKHASSLTRRQDRRNNSALLAKSSIENYQFLLTPLIINPGNDDFFRVTLVEVTEKLHKSYQFASVKFLYEF